MSKLVSQRSGWLSSALALGLTTSCTVYHPAQWIGSNTAQPEPAQRECTLCRLGQRTGAAGTPSAALRAAGPALTRVILSNKFLPTGSISQPQDCDPARTDCCPNDPLKTDPGQCGCNVPEIDSDHDLVPDCVDTAPYGWQRRLTIDGSQVAGTLMGFQMLVRLTDPHLQQEAAPDGADIHFIAEDRSTLLSYELEAYDPAAGALVAWVTLPTLPQGTDSVFYLGYGDGAASRERASEVWHAYQYVWHMAEDPATPGKIKDSAGHADGTLQGNLSSSSFVPALAGEGLAFDGNVDQIAFTNDFFGTSDSTIGAWVNLPARPAGNGSVVIAFGTEAQNQARILTAADRSTGGSKVGFSNSNEVRGTTLASGVWTHLVWTWEKAAFSTLYVNGQRAVGPSQHRGASTVGSSGRIGNTLSSARGYYLLGQLDEVRVVPFAISEARIATEYNCQRPGSTFIKEVAAPEPLWPH